MTKAVKKAAVETGYYAQTARIGRRLREIRKERSETLVSIAEKTGLSPSTLSKMENDKMSPTFGNLMRLAEGLRISLTDLVTPASGPQGSSARLTVTRGADVEYRRTPGYDMGPLCADLVQKRMTPLIERVRARYPVDEEKMISHSGEEFVYVLSGEIDVLTDCYASQRLGAGDSIYLDSGMMHTYVTVSKEDAEILMIWLSQNQVPGDKTLEIAEALLNEKA